MQLLPFFHTLDTSAREMRPPGRKEMEQQDFEGKPSLQVRRAFVVQFRAEADVEQGKFVGRVEHVVSGQATRFHSLEELMAFFARVLTNVRTEPPKEP